MKTLDRTLSALALLSVLTITGCAGTGNTTGSGGSTGLADLGGSASGQSTDAPVDLTHVKTWSIDTVRFLGKSPDIQQLAADTSDLMIVDPADLASKDNPLDKQLAAVRGKSHKRIVLALVNAAYVAPTGKIWNPAWVDSSGRLSTAAPAWLEQPTSTQSKDQVPAQYPVRYWNADFQKLLIGEAQQMSKAGFDGVCIDGTAAFTRNVPDRPTSAADMAALVNGVADQARKPGSTFFVVPVDNGALADKLDDKALTEYLKRVDGVVAENVFYHGDKPVDNDLDPQPGMIAALDKYENAHRPVFVTDAVRATDKVADFQERAKARGYLPANQPSSTAMSPSNSPQPTASVAQAPKASS